MQKYNQGLFYDWVPKPIMLLLIIILALVLFSINPIYTANISYMVSSLGIMTEDLLWANYASVIGMGLAMPLFLRLKARFRVKETLTGSLIAMAFLFWLMATTDQAGIIIAAALLIGGDDGNTTTAYGNLKWRRQQRAFLCYFLYRSIDHSTAIGLLRHFAILPLQLAARLPIDCGAMLSNGTTLYCLHA